MLSRSIHHRCTRHGDRFVVQDIGSAGDEHHEAGPHNESDADNQEGDVRNEVDEPQDQGCACGRLL